MAREFARSFQPGGLGGAPWRQLSTATHRVRILLGCSAVALAWLLPGASPRERVLFAFLAGAYLPFTLLVRLLARNDAPFYRVATLGADLLVVFMFQAVFPQTRTVTLFVYLVELAFQTGVGGLPAGAVVVVSALGLTALAQTVNPAAPYIGWFVLGMFGTSASGLAFIVERASGEQRRALRQLDETVAALHDARAQLDEAYAMAHIGSWKWDIAEDRVTGSSELYRMLGVDDAPMPYADFVQCAHPDDRTMVDGALRECRKSGEPFDGEARALLPDGSVKWIDARGHAVTSGNGCVVALVGTLQDISSRKDDERIRREFISMVSHDLRTPLTSIKGFAELMRDSDDNVDPAENAEYLGYIEASADEMASLTEQLLEYSRLEQGQMQLSHEVLELDEWIADLAEQVAPVMADHVVQVDVDRGLELEADALALRRVLTNLMQNAAKFAPAGSTITVTARRKADDVVLSVSDNGPGIAAADRERIFEAFYRGSAPQRGKGTGLGLAISQRYVALHGGRIWIQDTGPHGTTIAISLPRTATRSVAERGLSVPA